MHPFKFESLNNNVSNSKHTKSSSFSRPKKTSAVFPAVLILSFSQENSLVYPRSNASVCGPVIRKGKREKLWVFFQNAHENQQLPRVHKTHNFRAQLGAVCCFGLWCLLFQPCFVGEWWTSLIKTSNMKARVGERHGFVEVKISHVVNI